MVEMRKLLQFKKILSLAEAAQNLSTFFNHTMTVGDVLNFGLDGSLQLSVNFLSPTKVRVGDRLPDDIDGDESIPDVLLPADESLSLELPNSAKGMESDCDENPSNPELDRSGLATLPIGVPVKSRNGKSSRAEFRVVRDNRLTPPSGLKPTIASDESETALMLALDVVTITGVFDLPMIGDERQAVESELQRQVGGPQVSPFGQHGVYVVDGEGKFCQLQIPYDEATYKAGVQAKEQRIKEYVTDNNLEFDDELTLLCQLDKTERDYLEYRKQVPTLQSYLPALTLPKECTFVVRTQALLDFERKIANGSTIAVAEPDHDKPLGNREKNSLLTTIGVLCMMGGYDFTKHAKTARLITENVQLMGINIGETTIEKQLKQVADILQNHKK